MPFQEKKNFEFYFNPSTIQNHMDMVLRECEEKMTDEKGYFNGCQFQIDYDHLPSADELRDALMT